MSDQMSSFRLVKGNESRLFKILFAGIILVVAALFLKPIPSKPEYRRLLTQSMVIMQRIIVAVHIYESELAVYPNGISALPLDDLMNGEDGSTNPREGFWGYHFRAPEAPLDEIDVQELTELAVLFEVRDDGTVAYDSGVIGYADGHVEYIQAGE